MTTPALSVAGWVPCSTLGHVSEGPPTIPDGRISRVRFWPRPSTLSRIPAFPSTQKLKRWLAYTAVVLGLPGASLRQLSLVRFRLYVRARSQLSKPPSAQSPFAHVRYYRRWQVVKQLVRGHSPSFIAHTGSCASPNSSFLFRVLLITNVFAGCCPPLLEVGHSRHYLCNPCAGDWTPTPPCSSGALTRFFPKDIGLTLRETRLAHESTPAIATSAGSPISGL